MSEINEDCTHDCSSCSSSCPSRENNDPDRFLEKLGEGSRVGKVIGVVSGKGGVGKSLVAGMLASAFAKKGYKSAVLDADITGPSIPRMFGIKGRAAAVAEGIIPSETDSGIKIMSINLMLENPTDPVIWRGPVIAGVVKQFWTDVIWGDVDYMFVDMPPGTGDVPLTVFQSIPLDGVVIVSSPQELVSMIVSKAVNMANMMNIPIVGLVENMSYVECPDCGRKIYLYGESHIEEAAAENNTRLLSRLPINPAFSAACDKGNIEELTGDQLNDAVEAVIALPNKRGAKA